MDSLFSFIPQNMDKSLRLALIFLIALQFTAFVLYMFFTIKDFLKIRKERINDENKDKSKTKISEKEDDANKTDKLE